MELTIEYAEGKSVVNVKPVDIVAFERHYDLSYEASQAAPRIEYVFFLAWNALRRAGETRSFDEWMDSVEDIEAPDVAAPKAPRKRSSRA